MRKPDLSSSGNCEHCAFRDDAGFQVTPQLNEQATRQGDNAYASLALAALAEALLIPEAELALRLVAHPAPGDFDHDAKAGTFYVCEFVKLFYNKQHLPDLTFARASFNPILSQLGKVLDKSADKHPIDPSIIGSVLNKVPAFASLTRVGVSWIW